MKKLLFLTGTRADFGKLKSLIRAVEDHSQFEAHIFITGMHMLSKYGSTATEVEKSGFKFRYKFINQSQFDSMDIVLSKTIQGLSDYVKELKPDLIVIHGDRVEAMAGAIVGSLNNIRVAHIEGGEVSGTIDELIRHAVTKMSHVHFVSNDSAKHRLIQLGESESSIYTIGSPDLDIMNSKDLPSIEQAMSKYEIPFDDYIVFMYHPVTTSVDTLSVAIEEVVSALIESERNFVVVYPNNDLGSDIILNEFKRLEGNKRFRVFPSIRFEFFLTLLKNSVLMMGNSSAGVREMPFYGLPSINIGSRQDGRARALSIFNVPDSKKEILESMEVALGSCFKVESEFGSGNSDVKFMEAISSRDFWNINKQKVFVDINN